MKSIKDFFHVQMYKQTKTADSQQPRKEKGVKNRKQQILRCSTYAETVPDVL